MSIIVGVQGKLLSGVAQTILGSDRRVSDGSLKHTSNHSKVASVNGILFGTVGPHSYSDLIIHHLPEPLTEKYHTGGTLTRWCALYLVPWLRTMCMENQLWHKEEIPYGLPGSLLVAADDQLQLIGRDGALPMFTRPYIAIGSGAPVAYGAMWEAHRRKSPPIDIAEAGVHAACQFDDGCGSPVCITSVPSRSVEAS